MGTFASTRGWLEIDFSQRPAAEAVIRRHHHDLYSGGWAFPAKPFNWTLYLFYGGDLREGELPWLHAQLADLATLPPPDADGDLPTGFFLITDERGGATTWHIRHGTVEETPDPSLSWLDD